MGLLLIRFLLLMAVVGLVLSGFMSWRNRRRGLPRRLLWRWIGGTSAAVLIALMAGVYLVVRDMH